MNEEFDFEDREDEYEEVYPIADYLLKAVRATKNTPTAVDKLDYSQFRDESKDGWSEVAEGDTLPLQLQSLVKQSILLPRESFQLPIALSYLLLPSALCNRVPIAFSQGPSGCGKSAFGLIASKLHGSSPISAGSTFASIRNTIATMRVWDVRAPLEHVGNERNAVLVWEDISPNDLLGDNSNIFALLKNGVERSGTITIAELGGTNKTFKIFSPKYISSIRPIYARHEFRELIRRLIIIQHKPRSTWVSEDYDASNSETLLDDLIDLGDLNWEGIQGAYRDFWEDRVNLESWGRTARSLNSTRTHGMDANSYKMSKDLICCGVVCGVWSSVSEGIEHLRHYWEWHKENIESQASATTKALSHFIESQIKGTREANQHFIEQGLKAYVVPLEIQAEQLKKHVDFLRSQGELDSNGTTSDINSAMAQLGWELKPNAANKNSWQPINS